MDRRKTLYNINIKKNFLISYEIIHPYLKKMSKKFGYFDHKINQKNYLIFISQLSVVSRLPDLSLYS